MDANMTNPKIVITKRHAHNLSGFAVWIDAVDVVTNKTWTATQINMKETKQYEADGESPMMLSLDNAQLLMDNLWEVGIRPSEGSGSAGSLAATQKHLNDMRTIAFNKLNITEQFSQ